MQHRPDEFSYIYPIKTDELKDSENACIKRIAENHFYIEPFSDSKDALQQDLHRANFKINMILPEDKSKYERIEMAYRQECVSIGGSAFISALGATGNSLMVRAGSIENILDVKAGALISKQGDFSVFTANEAGAAGSGIWEKEFSSLLFSFLQLVTSVFPAFSATSVAVTENVISQRKHPEVL